MTDEQDTALIARQLAELTQHVDEMAKELAGLRERANTSWERADVQQERIDLAARELAQVSERLQAAANALRESI
ncbi:MAG: hypothetical protein ACJ76O_09485 [Gaiellaceae bacterium]